MRSLLFGADAVVCPGMRIESDPAVSEVKTPAPTHSNSQAQPSPPDGTSDVVHTAPAGRSRRRSYTQLLPPCSYAEP